MSISFDTSNGSAIVNSSNTKSITIGGSSTCIVVSVYYNPAGVDTLTVTWNGVALTQVNTGVDIHGTIPPDYNGGNIINFLYYLLNPATGTHTLSISDTNGRPIGFSLASYNGVFSVGANGRSGSITAGNLSPTVTTFGLGSWTVLGLASVATVTALAGTTQRNTQNTAVEGIYDSNGIVSAGSNTLGTNNAANSGSASVILEIQPFQPDFVSASDTTTLTESVTIRIFLPLPLKSDTTVITENVSLRIGVTSTSSDYNSQLTTSNYKWLTSTLLTAQQNYAVRPYFKAVVLDDTVQPNQLINNLGSLQPLAVGGAVTAPDGSLLAAGFDNSNHISFFKASNIHASNGVWDISTTLDSSGTSILGGAAQRVVITCSDWINGSYHIDIFYFNNFGSGSNLNVIQKYSDDKGLTWSTRTEATGLASTNYPVKNLSLCAFKPRLVNGIIQSGFAFIQPNGQVFANNTFTSYQIMYTLWNGSTWGDIVVWAQKNANSWDWTLHSLDSFYLNGIDYIVFSGFRNFIDSANTAFLPGNYSIWITSFLRMNDVTSGPDIMSKPLQIFSSSATNATNQNLFIYPVATVTNGTVNILFRAVTIATVSQSAQGSTSQIVTTNVNYMLIKTIDGLNFTYPSIVVFTDGTELNDLNQPQNYNSYTNQGQYYYILGSGKLWEFIQNNTLADISNDVVQYSVQDSAGQPSSVTVQLANQNNMWYPNGTNQGANAISKNKKILIQQGYYNANGVAEVIPRNTYYIDDINQSTDFRSNNITLTGRDLYKKLKTTITKYAYGWLGPYLYADIFDGSTLSNWSQISGNWTEKGNSLQLLSPITVGSTFNPIPQSVISLSSIPTFSYGSFMSVTITRNINGIQSIYAFYLDSDNWLRLDITDGNWAIRNNVAGVTNNLDSGIYNLASGQSNPIFIRRYDYYKFSFFLGTSASVVLGNPIFAQNSIYLFKNSSTGEFDMTSSIITMKSQPLTVALGVDSFGTSYVGDFQFFRFSQFDNSNNISELIKSLATKSGIMSYDIQNNIVDGFNDTTAYTGTFTHPNNTLIILTGNRVINSLTANKIGNGEIIFNAKVIPTNSGSPYGFKLAFRTQTILDEYYWEVLITATGGYQSSRFWRMYNGTPYFFPAQMSDVTSNLPGTLYGSNNFDLTQVHEYKIVMIDGWFMGFIDGIMVNAWNDNNTTANYLTTGNWGWISNSNSTLTVYNMKSTAFWKQVNQFSLNPGDDIENAITSLIQTVRAWVFSNIVGTLKAIFLNSTDTSTYTYQNQIFAQGVDSSDKEFVSQVTVYGDSVTAVARDTTLMAGRSVREEVIVDYSIKTQQDAQTRASYELTNANQYQSQYNPKQTMNVGAELFDAVTVVDTGNNTSGVNSTSRVYAQKFTVGGNNNEYSVEIDTGNL